MKKTVFLILTLALCCGLRAQDAEQFNQRYQRQVAAAGISGAGVEYVLDQWAEVFPDDCRMLEGRFLYYYDKSRSEEVRAIPGKKKYLGRKPVLTLKDSLGRDVNYFTVPLFADSLFRISQRSIDRAIALEPSELSHRLHRISALADYEKDSPDMASTALLDLIDLYMDRKSGLSWKMDGKPLEEGEFESAMQEYCVLFYTKGSDNSYESFRIVSEKLSSLFPKNPLFQNNLGAYWQVVKENDKKAAKFYKKALKLNPEDSAAKTNLSIIEKKKAKNKNKK